MKKMSFLKPILNFYIAALVVTTLSRVLLVLLFNDGADINDLFTMMWLLGGNLEPDRDISVIKVENRKQVILIDATFKTESHDNFKRDWPNVVTMDDHTISEIDKKWNEWGLGDLIKSPSLKFKRLVMGDGAVRKED